MTWGEVSEAGRKMRVAIRPFHLLWPVAAALIALPGCSATIPNALADTAIPRLPADHIADSEELIRLASDIDRNSMLVSSRFNEQASITRPQGWQELGSLPNENLFLLDDMSVAASVDVADRYAQALFGVRLNQLCLGQGFPAIQARYPDKSGHIAAFTVSCFLRTFGRAGPGETNIDRERLERFVSKTAQDVGDAIPDRRSAHHALEALNAWIVLASATNSIDPVVSGQIPAMTALLTNALAYFARCNAARMDCREEVYLFEIAAGNIILNLHDRAYFGALKPAVLDIVAFRGRDSSVQIEKRFRNACSADGCSYRLTLSAVRRVFAAIEEDKKNCREIDIRAIYFTKSISAFQNISNLISSYFEDHCST